MPLTPLGNLQQHGVAGRDGATNCTDAGMPSAANPHGIETTGAPAQLHGAWNLGVPVVANVAGAVVSVEGQMSTSA